MMRTSAFIYGLLGTSETDRIEAKDAWPLMSGVLDP